MKKDKWYFTTSTLVIGFLLVGPFILPLALVNPNYSRRTKIWVSLVIVGLGCLLGVVMGASLKSIKDYYGQLSDLSPR